MASSRTGANDGWEPYAVLQRLLVETRSPREVPTVPVLPAAVPTPGPTSPLPDPVRSGEPLEECLARRVAVRNFASDEVSLNRVASILESAAAIDRVLWGETMHTPLALLLLAWRIETLIPGLYAYDRVNRALALLTLVSSSMAREYVLQVEFADAAGIVLVFGDLGAALEQDGAHGHRLLLVRAGAAAHAAWLASLTVGLEGTVFAGLLTTAALRLSGADGYTRAPLFAFAFGGLDR